MALYTMEHIDEIGSRPVIWDLRDCEMGSYTYAASKRNFGMMSAIADRRRGARTALVCAGGVQFGISRMIEVLGKICGYPVEIRAFRCMETAETWVRGCEGAHKPHADA